MIFHSAFRAHTLKKAVISGENRNWHASCLCMAITVGWSGRRSQGVFIMSITKLQNVAVALFGAVMVASLFIGAAVPVTPIA